MINIRKSTHLFMEAIAIGIIAWHVFLLQIAFAVVDRIGKPLIILLGIVWIAIVAVRIYGEVCIFIPSLPLVLPP